MTFCMNVSRFMNLAAIFSLDLESQYKNISLSEENYLNLNINMHLPCEEQCSSSHHPTIAVSFKMEQKLSESTGMIMYG